MMEGEGKIELFTETSFILNIFMKQLIPSGGPFVLTEHRQGPLEPCACAFLTPVPPHPHPPHNLHSRVCIIVSSKGSSCWEVMSGKGVTVWELGASDS